MFESESNNLIESSAQIPREIQVRFSELSTITAARTVLPWGEHCTECAVPDCYNTCSLYEPRVDRRCRRFLDGMVRVKGLDSLSSYGLKIIFKQWGQLWTVGNCHLFSRRNARLLEWLDLVSGAILRNLPLPATHRWRFTLRWYDCKKKWGRSLKASEPLPESFLLACYNPQNESIPLSITIRPMDKKKQKLPFQASILLRPGFNRESILVSNIAQYVNLHEQFEIFIIPDEAPEGTTIFFGAMDFIIDGQKASGTVRKYKCVVWDLDNTIWSGTLVEDGADNLVLKPGITHVIKELDQRGILHSIASKNNHDEAIRVLKKFGLEKYFLYPQISWQPKSKAVRQIAADINIGIDSLLLMDDSEFERAQVKSACPEVRTVDAGHYSELPEWKEFQIVPTEDSRQRREMYLSQIVRERIYADFEEEYIDFLKQCDITLRVKTMKSDNLQRVHELTQRTNQMNFSGNRYELEQLEKMINKKNISAIVLDCRDKFGNYGTVGFCVIDNRRPIMNDLMFSCRIQSKRVEHAFLSYILNKYAGRDFFVRYRKTQKNAPSGKVFDDFAFETLEIKNGISFLIFRREREVPPNNIVSVINTDRRE